MNNLELMGYVANDPHLVETINTKTPMCYVNLTLTNVSKNGVVSKTYVPCIVFHDLAKHIHESYSKGDAIHVKGHLQSRETTDGKSYLVVVIHQVLD